MRHHRLMTRPAAAADSGTTRRPPELDLGRCWVGLHQMPGNARSITPEKRETSAVHRRGRYADGDLAKAEAILRRARARMAPIRTERDRR
jgi:hypothetical protein